MNIKSNKMKIERNQKKEAHNPIILQVNLLFSFGLPNRRSKINPIIPVIIVCKIPARDIKNEWYFNFFSMADLASYFITENYVIAQIEVGYNKITSFTTTIWHSMEVVRVTKVLTEEENPVSLPCCP